MRHSFITTFFSFIFLLPIFSCKSIKETSICDQKKYEKELVSTLYEIGEGKIITDKMIINLIPQNEEQYLIFYSMTYPERSSEIRTSFMKFNSIFFNRANHQNEILDLYILLSQFVDGEYADSYFAHLEFLIVNNKLEFCEFFSKEEQKLSRINEYNLKYCKGQ